MRKLLALIPLFCMLLLSGCDLLPTSSSDPTEEPTRPANPEQIMIDYAAPAMKVTVSINPQLELILNFSNEVLQANALNADAQTLLEDMTLPGMSYSAAMTAILDKTQAQGYLKDNSDLTIETQELMDGAWTPFSQRLLLRPVDDFEAKAELTLNCDFTPAGDAAPEIFKTHTVRGDDYTETKCYDAANRHILSRYIYDNGDYSEHYHYSWGFGPYSGESFFWGADGKYEYSSTMNGRGYNYTVYPDGSRDTTTTLYDDQDNITWRYSEDADGSTTETLYSNGDPSHQTRIGADGSSSETLWQNGKIHYDIYRFPDGTTWESFYENGELTRHLSSYPDGSTSETFYENGKPVRTVDTDADGTVTERDPNANNGEPAVTAPNNSNPGADTDDHRELTYHDNGKIKTDKYTYDNGDYTLDTYYEDGTKSSHITDMDDIYIEEHYDESGNPKSSYYKNAEGYVQSVTYYSNGQEKNIDVTEPNGNYQSETYYENGNPATRKIQSDGYYTEESYSENGNPISSFSKYSDGGEETVLYYSNGNKKSSEITWPNGEYRTELYYEDGTLRSSAENMDGHQSEYQYYENGVRMSMYFKNESGSEQTATYYSNGNEKTLEMIMTNGDYEYIAYYENGQTSHHIQKQDGQTWEYFYDEEGNRISKPSE